MTNRFWLVTFVATIMPANCQSLYGPKDPFVIKPLTSVGILPAAPPKAVTLDLATPTHPPVVPSTELEIGKLSSIVPEYGHHIQVIEQDVTDLKQKMWWTSGAAWAIGGLIAGLAGIFIAAWKPILRALIEEAAPRIIR